MSGMKFKEKGVGEFHKTLNNRVDQYFMDKRTRKGTPYVVIKSILLVLVYLGLCASIFWIDNNYAIWGLAALIGFFQALVGINVGHESMHYAIFKSKKANRFFGYSFELIGFNSYAWYLKHTILHHTYPNTENVDPYIEGAPVLRMNPSEKRYFFHRYQHLYAPVAYILLGGVKFVFIDDIVFFLKKMKGSNPPPILEWAILIFTKLAYVAFFLLVPLLVWEFSFIEAFLWFQLMLACHSVIWSAFLTPEHFFEETNYIRADDGELETSWIKLQLYTTMDYARKSKTNVLFFGGLNLNVVHHLFPAVSHIHLPDISDILKETAEEYGMPYYEKSYSSAIKSHFKSLRILGQQEVYPTHKDFLTKF